MSYTELQAQVYGASIKDQEAFENRAYYDDDLNEIFKKIDKDDRPDVPSGLCASIINRSVDHLFPEGTAIKTNVAALEEEINSIKDSTKLLKVLGVIGIEGHVAGTLALKSTLNTETKKWELTIQCLESLHIDHDPLNCEKIISIRIRFRFKQVNPQSGKEEEYWYQERWTEALFEQWEPILYVRGQLPNFDAAPLTEASGAHHYGAIPITILRHQLQLDTPFGKAEIDSKMKAYSKQLAISLSKVGTAGQLISTPAYKRINDKNKDRWNVKPGSILDLDSEGEGGADFGPIEHPDTPEGVFRFQEKLKAMAFEAANVTNPDNEKEMGTGNTPSSVAWKAFNYNFVKKIKRLRVRYGEEGIEEHLRLILKMGKSLGLPKYGSVNPDNPKTYEVELVYPAFFEATTAEKQEEVNLIKSSNLPAEEAARRIAAVLDIQDEEVIKAIQADIEDEKEAMKPTKLGKVALDA